MLIGEVARRSGVSARMLRHYEAQGLVRPTGRTAAGYREYTEADIRRIFHIECLRSLGLSLAEVRRALEEPGFAPAALVADLVARTRQRIAQEEELLDRLQWVAATEPDDWRDVLRIVRLLRTLDAAPPALRQRTVLAEGGAAQPPAAVLARAVLAETEPNLAGALRWALARAGEAATTSLAEGLRAPQVDVRRRAVEAVADIPGDAAAALLAEALSDPDDVVRSRAALALGARGQRAAVPELARMAADGRCDVEAAELLGSLATDEDVAEQVVAELLRQAGPGAGVEVRRRLAQALTEVPGAAARRALTDLAADPDPAVWLTARAVLERGGA
ncbi:MAG TPA: MerR family transcriptional regulator [Actinomycetaceae bacterium]|nr:MerR family transcriptional regulator [Actinomycetaceae bacterium]